MQSSSIPANPRNYDQATGNLLSFSNEARLSNQHLGGSSLIPIDLLPRMAACYGWLTLNASVFKRMPRKLAKKVGPFPFTANKMTRSLSKDADHIAIVYEYIEDGENDPTIVEQVAYFLCHVGFCHGMSPLAKNWKNGVLVDYSDIIHPNGHRWTPKPYKYRLTLAKDILME